MEETAPPCPLGEQDLNAPTPSLPVTDVSFLCIKWGCSWCSWPAMQKGHGFNFGLIFIDFRQHGTQSHLPW